MLSARLIILRKTANDIRQPASGPRCGLGELSLLKNAGKGQPDSMRSHDNGRGAGSWQQRAGRLRRLARNFELNVFKPVIIYNCLHSVALVHDACSGREQFYPGLRALLNCHAQRQVLP